jgi:antitoxin Phd
MALFLYIYAVQLKRTTMEVSMRTINYSEARQNLAEVLESAVTGVPVTITRRGHKPAVIISAEEFERYQAARLDDEFAAIMAIHGNEIEELADK